MITLDLNVKGKSGSWYIKDEILFNAILSKNTQLIKKFIKSIHPLYKITNTLFEIVNNYVDFSDECLSLYCGLIVRTGLRDYAVLYLEGTSIDEDYMINLIDEYIHDIGERIPKEVNVCKFEINKKAFLHATKKL